MTNLTIKEKQALEEVFLCFQNQEKWYQKKICSKKTAIYKVLRLYVRNRNTIRRFFIVKKRLIFKS